MSRLRQLRKPHSYRALTSANTRTPPRPGGWPLLALDGHEALAVEVLARPEREVNSTGDFLSKPFLSHDLPSLRIFPRSLPCQPHDLLRLAMLPKNSIIPNNVNALVSSEKKMT